MAHKKLAWRRRERLRKCPPRLIQDFYVSVTLFQNFFNWGFLETTHQLNWQIYWLPPGQSYFKFEFKFHGLAIQLGNFQYRK